MIALAAALAVIGFLRWGLGSESPVSASEVLEAANAQDYRFAEDRAARDELWRDRTARYEARASAGDAMILRVNRSPATATARSLSHDR